MKRWFDIVVSSTLLVALSPLYLIIFMLVYLDIGWPVFEKQRYPGMNEQWFTIYRFRTMNRACNEKGELLPANQRLSVIGYYLKRFKLDRLPEFYNVLRGEMSLVGPRPGFIRSIPSKDVNLTRHSVCPGMTGWSQLHGKSLTWEEKLALDLYYVKHQSLWFDIKILVLSLGLLFIKKPLKVKITKKDE